jgi:hypothetical protein
LLSDRGRNLVKSRVDELTNMRLVDLKDGVTHEF